MTKKPTKKPAKPAGGAQKDAPDFDQGDGECGREENVDEGRQEGWPPNDPDGA